MLERVKSFSPTKQHEIYAPLTIYVNVISHAILLYFQKLNGVFASVEFQK